MGSIASGMGGVPGMPSGGGGSGGGGFSFMGVKNEKLTNFILKAAENQRKKQEIEANGGSATAPVAANPGEPTFFNATNPASAPAPAADPSKVDLTDPVKLALSIEGRRRKSQTKDLLGVSSGSSNIFGL